MHDESDATNACPRVGRWIGGCRFEARYDRIPPEKTISPFTGCAQFELSSEIQLRTKRAYVADVCTRCGKVVKREGV